MKYRAVYRSLIFPALVAATAAWLAACGSSGSGAPPGDGGSTGDGTIPDGTTADAKPSDGGDGGRDAQPGDATDGGMAADAPPSDGAGPDAPTDAGPSDGGPDGPSDGGPDGPSDASPDQNAAEAGPVSFAVDPSRGPMRQHKPPATPVPVSPYIYGVNASGPSGATGAFTARKTRWGLVRKGGNAFTAWNWTNDFYNLGNLDCFWQGPAPGGAGPAATLTQDTDSIGAAQAEGAAYLATVPIVDHVAAAVSNPAVADASGFCPATAMCDGGTAMTTANVNSNNLDFAAVDPTSAAFVPNRPRKPGAYCPCPPGPACDAGCVVSTNPVYEDEFVHFVQQTYGGDAGAGGATVFFDLDNEPNYWGYTHPEVWPATAPPPCGDSTVTFDDIVTRDVAFASGIKAAWPSALVFGPVVAQDGIVYAHSYDKDPHYPTEFVDYYLAQTAAAAAEAGAPLVDVLDVQYYNGFTGTDPTSQCLQRPRMFWDPQFTALSPTDTDRADWGYGGKGPNQDYFDTNWYPRQVIPRLLGKIDTAYGASAAAPKLAFSEYNSGCETDIAGGLAEADNLGVFGREGVFAAAVMAVQPPAASYILGAFDLYRNYDGNGAVVGDTAVAATTSNVDTSSVYAFAHSDDPAALDLVVINKAPVPVIASLSVMHAGSFTTVRAYQLAGGSVAVTAVPPALTPAVTCAAGACTMTYTMPALTATTLVLR